MNATDSAVVAVSLCEILDVATGNVLSTAQHTDTVGAMGRSVVSVDFEAPAGVQGVIYRVKSTAGLFTDGEQTLLPVIPSEQDVVESEMFYIAPGQDSFSIRLDAPCRVLFYAGKISTPSPPRVRKYVSFFPPFVPTPAFGTNATPSKPLQKSLHRL